MTPEEMNRAIEFTLQHQAQTSLHLEELARHQVRERELLAQVAVQGNRVGALLELQSRRLDRLEEQDRVAQARHDELQERHEKLQERHEKLLRELQAGLERIFNKLST